MLGTILLLASFLGPQESGSMAWSWRPPQTTVATVLTGKVMDRSGAALPGATVTLEVAPPAPARGIVAGDGGVFKFDKVVPGTYTVKFELAGFLPYSRTGLVLAAGQSKTLNVALELGPNSATEHPTVAPSVGGMPSGPKPLPVRARRS